MPPEVARAALAGEALRRDDPKAERRRCCAGSTLYGLGTILHYLLTGGPPLDEAEGDKILSADERRTRIYQRAAAGEGGPAAARNPHVDRTLEAICLRLCLDASPERRYEPAAALAADLTNWLEHRPTSARAYPPWERGGLWCRRNWKSLVGCTRCWAAGAGAGGRGRGLPHERNAAESPARQRGACPRQRGRGEGHRPEGAGRRQRDTGRRRG